MPVLELYILVRLLHDLLKDWLLYITKSSSENCQVGQAAGTSEENKGEPVGRLLAPAGTDASSSGHPTRGALNNPTSSRELGFTRDWARVRWFASASAMFDLLDVTFGEYEGMHIFIGIAFIRTEMRLRRRTFDGNISRFVWEGASSQRATQSVARYVI